MGIAVQSVARSSKITGAHRGILGISTYIYIHICARWKVANLGKRRVLMVMMTKLWFGSIWTRSMVLLPPLGCSKCKRTFSSIKFQVPHIKKCEELRLKKTKSFGCDKCTKRYMTQKVLDGHHLFHQGLAERFTCDICGAEYMHKTSLTAHMKAKHLEEVEEEEKEEEGVVELE